MKRFFTIISALALASAASADDLSLYCDTQGATNALCTVAEAQKIVFNNGTMTLVKKDGTQQTMALSAVQRLYFSTPEAVSIDKVASLPTNPTAIYDLTGRRVSANNINELPKGIYIVDGRKVNIK